MDEDGVFLSHLVPELADGFQKGLAFDVACGAADLYDGDPYILAGFVAVKTAFDLVSDMGNYLDRSAAVVSPALLVKDGPVDLAGGNVGIPVQIFVYKSFIMPQVQICFRTVLRDEYLSVLDGIHGSGVNVYVGIKFLHGDFISPGLQKASKGSSGDSFSQTGNNASGHKYVFYTHNISVSRNNRFSPCARLGRMPVPHVSAHKRRRYELIHSAFA